MYPFSLFLSKKGRPPPSTHVHSSIYLTCNCVPAATLNSTMPCSVVPWPTIPLPSPSISGLLCSQGVITSLHGAVAESVVRCATGAELGSPVPRSPTAPPKPQEPSWRAEWDRPPSAGVCSIRRKSPVFATRHTCYNCAMAVAQNIPHLCASSKKYQ